MPCHMVRCSTPGWDVVGAPVMRRNQRRCIMKAILFYFFIQVVRNSYSIQVPRLYVAGLPELSASPTI